jgi:hypothetical protein
VNVRTSDVKEVDLGRRIYLRTTRSAQSSNSSRSPYLVRWLVSSSPRPLTGPFSQVPRTVQPAETSRAALLTGRRLLDDNGLVLSASPVRHPEGPVAPELHEPCMVALAGSPRDELQGGTVRGGRPPGQYV